MLGGSGGQCHVSAALPPGKGLSTHFWRGCVASGMWSPIIWFTLCSYIQWNPVHNEYFIWPKPKSHLPVFTAVKFSKSATFSLRTSWSSTTQPEIYCKYGWKKYCINADCCQKLLLHSHDFWQVMSHSVLALTHAACATKVTLILNWVSFNFYFTQCGFRNWISTT